MSSTTPAGGASDVALDSDVAITFNEPVDVADGWFSISCATSGDHAAAASAARSPSPSIRATDFAANEHCTVTVLAANVTDQDTDDPPDNMAANHVFSFQTIGTFTLRRSRDPDPRRPGQRSCYADDGAVVTIEGVVVGDYQGPGEFNGYYLQEEAADVDADPLTSEGIFVFSAAPLLASATSSVYAALPANRSR